MRGENNTPSSTSEPQWWQSVEITPSARRDQVLQDQLRLAQTPVRPTSRTKDFTLFLYLPGDLSFQIPPNREALSRDMPQSWALPGRSLQPALALIQLLGKQEQPTTGTATHPCSLGGSRLAGRRQTKPTQHSSHQASLRIWHFQDNAGFNHHGAPAPLSLHPTLLCHPEGVWLLPSQDLKRRPRLHKPLSRV